MTEHWTMRRLLGMALAALFAATAHAQALEPLRSGGSNRGCNTSIAVLPPPGMGEPSVTHLGLWSDMAKVWTFQRVNQQKLIKDRLAALGLRDINVVLAVVPPLPIREAACGFNVIPQTKQVFLRFEARDNAMSAVKRRGRVWTEGGRQGGGHVRPECGDVFRHERSAGQAAGSSAR